MARINNGQKQCIHIIRRKMWGDDRKAYEDILTNYYGAESCKDLSVAEASDFIDRLKTIQEGKPMPPIHRGRLWASDAQIRKIDALVTLLGWDEEKRLNGFIKRQTKRNKTKLMLTGGEATKVLIGLQRIAAKGDNELYNWLNSASGADITKRYHTMTNTYVESD